MTNPSQRFTVGLVPSLPPTPAAPPPPASAADTVTGAGTYRARMLALPVLNFDPDPADDADLGFSITVDRWAAYALAAEADAELAQTRRGLDKASEVFDRLSSGYLARAEAAEAERDRLGAVLAAVRAACETLIAYADRSGRCPLCQAWPNEPHLPVCEVQAIRAVLATATPTPTPPPQRRGRVGGRWSRRLPCSIIAGAKLADAWNLDASEIPFPQEVR